MKLPFQIRKTFTTALSEDDIIKFVRERLNRRHRLLFLSSPEYVGSIDGKSFKIYRNFDARYGRSNPKVHGTIMSSNPTTIEIKVSPHYLRILFFSIFPIVFVPAAILSDQMTINGVLREPELSDRIFCALFGGGGPTIWCYFDSIRPIKETEDWITEKLGLKEK
jgi:hypothetical protein